MGFIIEKCILLVILLSLNSVVESATNSSSSLVHLTNGYDVHVVNNLPPNSPAVFVHCASKDNELIRRPLALHEDYHWHFYMNVGKSTMYFCHFWWGSKNKAFEVFNVHIAANLCIDKGAAKTDHNLCIWTVQADGFYFQNGPAKLGSKLFGWT